MMRAAPVSPSFWFSCPSSPNSSGELVLAVQASASLTSIRTSAYSYRMKNKHAIHIKGKGMKTYVFRVVVEPDEDRWFASCPALRQYAATTWGHTQEEALKHIREVVQMVVEELIEDGEPIPEDVQVSQEPLVAVTI
jgi:predicted RNase H-like HicB family nuclease